MLRNYFFLSLSLMFFAVQSADRMRQTNFHTRQSIQLKNAPVHAAPRQIAAQRKSEKKSMQQAQFSASCNAEKMYIPSMEVTRNPFADNVVHAHKGYAFMLLMLLTARFIAPVSAQMPRTEAQKRSDLQALWNLQCKDFYEGFGTTSRHTACHCTSVQSCLEMPTQEDFNRCYEPNYRTCFAISNFPTSDGISQPFPAYAAGTDTMHDENRESQSQESKNQKDDSIKIDSDDARKVWNFFVPNRNPFKGKERTELGHYDYPKQQEATCTPDNLWRKGGKLLQSYAEAYGRDYEEMSGIRQLFSTNPEKMLSYIQKLREEAEQQGLSADEQSAFIYRKFIGKYGRFDHGESLGEDMMSLDEYVTYLRICRLREKTVVEEVPVKLESYELKISRIVKSLKIVETLLDEMEGKPSRQKAQLKIKGSFAIKLKDGQQRLPITISDSEINDQGDVISFVASLNGSTMKLSVHPHAEDIYCNAESDVCIAVLWSEDGTTIENLDVALIKSSAIGDLIVKTLPSFWTRV